VPARRDDAHGQLTLGVLAEARDGLCLKEPEYRLARVSGRAESAHALLHRGRERLRCLSPSRARGASPGRMPWCRECVVLLLALGEPALALEHAGVVVAEGNHAVALAAPCRHRCSRLDRQRGVGSGDPVPSPAPIAALSSADAAVTVR
jgi:hypothetical protein